MNFLRVQLPYGEIENACKADPQQIRGQKCGGGFRYFMGVNDC